MNNILFILEKKVLNSEPDEIKSKYYNFQAITSLYVELDSS